MYTQLNIFLILIIIYLILEILSNNVGYLSYRLGDTIRGYFYNDNRKFLLNYWYPIYYHNSLATKYLKATRNLPNNERFNNLNVLDKISNSDKKLDVSLHLRLGDVIGNFDKKKKIFNQRSGNKKITYFYQPNSYIKIAKKLNEMNINKVHVFYGSHTNKFDDNNKLYVNKIKKIFEQYNIKFINNSTNNADKDFKLMSNSKIFIQSGGGYSQLIAQLVSKRGNTVIVPDKV